MYIGIDIGGTKTLVAVLTNAGEIVESAKFLTPKLYSNFLLELAHAIHHLEHKDFVAAGVGMPVTVFDRKHGRGINFGNLPWKNVPVAHDIEKIVKCPLVLENDAKLAALSEAMLLRREYKKVLYVTVSTGIGIGFIQDGVIDEGVGDAGGRSILLEHRGKMMPWEDFASGRAIVERYHKRAVDITDTETWTKISRELAQGFTQLIALLQPEVIVIGGSVGTYFDRYGKILTAEIKKYHLPLIPMPKICSAQRPEEAVVYGCFDLAKQVYGKHS